MVQRFPNQGVGIQNVPIELPNEILASTSGLEKMPGGVTVGAGVRSRLIRAGEVVARLGADVVGVGVEGDFIARKSTELTATVATGQPVAVVDDSSPFEIGDTILLDDGVSAMDATVILAIDRDTNAITVAVDFTGGTNPSPIDSRLSVVASGQNDAHGIAATKYTPNAAIPDISGRLSVYTAGLFKLAALHGSDLGLDTTARAAFDAPAANDQILAQETAVRVRLGDPTAV